MCLTSRDIFSSLAQNFIYLALIRISFISAVCWYIVMAAQEFKLI
jgi:hypothetical protein